MWKNFVLQNPARTCTYKMNKSRQLISSAVYSLLIKPEVYSPRGLLPQSTQSNTTFTNANSPVYFSTSMSQPDFTLTQVRVLIFTHDFLHVVHLPFTLAITLYPLTSRTLIENNTRVRVKSHCDPDFSFINVDWVFVLFCSLPEQINHSFTHSVMHMSSWWFPPFLGWCDLLGAI